MRATWPIVIWVLLVCGLIGTLLALPRTAAAHAELVHTSPSFDGVVPVAGSQIRLWYSQAIASGGGSPSVRVLDAQGRAIRVTSVGVNPNDPTEVVATIPSLSSGTYTVAWNVISSVDGHPLRGTYAFRVASGMPAGAATTAGQTPAVWAVALRWLTFLGAALALGGCFFALIVLPGSVDTARGTRRRAHALLLGAVVALLATILEPVVQTSFPREGLQGSFLDMVRGEPSAWWLRPGALIPLVVLALVIAYPLRGRLPTVLAALGLGLSAIAYLGLALTGHGAVRLSWRDAATAVDVVHLWAVALWVGGLAHLALWWPSRSADAASTGDQIRVLRRFSAIALGLIVLAVASGVGNAVFILPARSSLWSSDYGHVLIAKSLVLFIPLGLAVRYRQALTHAISTTTQALRRTVRAEAVIVLAVVLGGSVLALSAPPVASRAPLDTVRLVAPALDPNGRVQSLLHLTIDPAAVGKNRLRFHLTDASGRSLAVRVPPLLSATFTSLTVGTVQAQVGAQPDPHHPGDYVIDGLQLSLNDWWRIAVQIEISGETPTEADFYLLMPDPNIHDPGPPPPARRDPEAQELYQRGLRNLLGLSRLRYSQLVNTGRDQLTSRQLAIVVDPRTGQTTASSATQAGVTTVAVGSRSWRQEADGRWQAGGDAALPSMTTWGEVYGGGINTRVGISGQSNGETTRVVTFYRPKSGQRPPAWFTWWVGTSTGRVYQIAMVSDRQYVLQTNSEFDGTFTIKPPAGG